MTTFYWEKAHRDKSLSPDQTLAYIKSGLASADRALAIKPDYVDALTYKNILLRMQSNLEANPVARQALIAEADALRNRAIELNRARGAGFRVAWQAASRPACKAASCRHRRRLPRPM